MGSADAMKIETVVIQLNVIVELKPVYDFALQKVWSFLGITGKVPADDEIYESGQSISQIFETLAKVENIPSDKVATGQGILLDACIEHIRNTKPELHSEAISLMQKLESSKIKIHLIFNGASKIANNILEVSALTKYCDYIETSEHVNTYFPSPRGYYSCCLFHGESPRNLLAIENSSLGLSAARAAGMHVYQISKRGDFSTDKIFEYIRDINIDQGLNPVATKWQSKMNIVILLDSYDPDFRHFGYGYPAPLVEVNGKPLIQRIVENINVQGHHYFIANKTDAAAYHLSTFLSAIAGVNSTVLTFDGASPKYKGVNQRLSLLKGYIPEDEPVLIATASEYIQWSSDVFLFSLAHPSVDGGVISFKSCHPAYSFIHTDACHWIKDWSIHVPKTNMACAAVLYFKKAAHVFKALDIILNAAPNTPYADMEDTYGLIKIAQVAVTEFGLKFKPHHCSRLWALRTPQDVEFFAISHPEYLK